MLQLYIEYITTYKTYARYIIYMYLKNLSSPHLFMLTLIREQLQ